MTARRTGTIGPVLGDNYDTYTTAAGAKQLPAIAGAGAALVPLPGNGIRVTGLGANDTLCFTPSIPLPVGVVGYCYVNTVAGVNYAQIAFHCIAVGGAPAGWAADTTFYVGLL